MAIDKKKLLLDVLDLVLKANGGIAERNGKGHPTGFFDYSGHTNTIYVTIHPDGWYSSNKGDSPCEKFVFPFWRTDEELEEEFTRLNRYVNELKLEEEDHVNVVPVN